MYRSVPIMFLAIAALLICADSASAQFFEGQSPVFGRRYGPQGAWCANVDTGADRVEELCWFDTFEACYREALLSRGFCTQNPALPVRPIKKNHRRRW
jgi:hypothetical protein